MADFDDTEPGGTFVSGGVYHPFEPVSGCTTGFTLFNNGGYSFLYCPDCDGYLDPWDISHDDYGDIRCARCASNNVKV